MIDNNINFLYQKNMNKIIKEKKPEVGLIHPINYTWKQMYKMMNKIKRMWNMNLFDINFNLDMQELSKIIFQNLQNCEKIPNLKSKNNILETDFLSFFQSSLLDILPKEKNLYDLYDTLFLKKQYIPKKDALFEDLILNFKDMFYKIEKSQKSKKQFEKLRWYFILDKINFSEDDKIDKFKNFIDFSDEVDNLNDYFNEVEKKAIYEEYEKNKNKKLSDNFEETYEKYIINDELVDKLLKFEKNKFFYLIKLIYLSINIFCKSSISHLLYTYINFQEKNEDSKIMLIHKYLKSFNNFVDSCTVINEKCANVNIAMNYLYKSLFEDNKNFPKFSIYRMCLKIWFKELNTHLIGDNTLLYEINNIISSAFSENLREDLFNKMEEKTKNNSFQARSYNTERSQIFNFNTSYNLFNSFPIMNDDITFNNFFGSVNTYENSDRQYKIMSKGLSIICDTFSNEYTAYFLNFSLIDTNSFYDNLVYGFEDSIKYYIEEVFNDYIYDKKVSAKIVLDNILEYFDNYFYKNFIIPNLRNKIYETVFLCIKHNLLKYSKNKYLNEKNDITTQQNSVFSSATTNWCSNNNLINSSIFGLDDDDMEKNFNKTENFEFKTEEFKKEIINYIIKNTSNNSKDNKSLYNQIEQKLDIINKQINLYDLFITNAKWHNEHINIIKETDEKVITEITKIKFKNNIDIPFEYDYINRSLLSYSLQYDWDFIKKANILINYFKINDDENEKFEYMEEDNNDFDFIGPDNDGQFNLKQSVFGF